MRLALELWRLWKMLEPPLPYEATEGYYDGWTKAAECGSPRPDLFGDKVIASWGTGPLLTAQKNQINNCLDGQALTNPPVWGTSLPNSARRIIQAQEHPSSGRRYQLLEGWERPGTGPVIYIPGGPQVYPTPAPSDPPDVATPPGAEPFPNHIPNRYPPARPSPDVDAPGAPEPIPERVIPDWRPPAWEPDPYIEIGPTPAPKWQPGRPAWSSPAPTWSVPGGLPDPIHNPGRGPVPDPDYPDSPEPLPVPDFGSTPTPLPTLPGSGPDVSSDPDTDSSGSGEPDLVITVRPGTPEPVSWTRTEPGHKQRRPKAGERERKIKVPPHVIETIYGKVTEAQDLVDNLYKNLDKRCRSKHTPKAWDPKKGRMVYQHSLEAHLTAVVKCWNTIDWPEAVKDIVADHIQDMVIGKASKAASKQAGREGITRPWSGRGFGSGPAVGGGIGQVQVPSLRF